MTMMPITITHCMIPNYKTFCAAPWFSIRNENRGEYRVCCEIDPDKSNFDGKKKYSMLDNTVDQWLNSPYPTYVRKSLNAGIKLPECSACWQKESFGARSLRQNMNNSVTDNKQHIIDQTWMPGYFKNKTDHRADLLLAADIKINNVCNYECVMCNPADSSLLYNRWVKDQHNEFVQDYTRTSPEYFQIIKDVYVDKDGESLLQDILSRPIRFLKLLGGEPLLNAKVIQMLSRLPDSKKCKISLSFVTNGSVDLNQIVTDLGNFKNINFVLSLEATDEMQQYLRKNSSWNKICENVSKYLRHPLIAEGRTFMSVYTVAQAMSVWHYPELKHWCNENQLELNTVILKNPDYLSFSVMPMSLRQQVLEKFDKSSLGGSSTDMIMHEIQNAKYDSALFEKFNRFIKWQDPQLDLLKYSPIWKEVIGQ